MIKVPKLGELDQGAVFSCGFAEDYRGCSTYGLIITARCDIAQGKAPVYNYLPVVQFDDWIHRDGREILSTRARQQVLGSLRGQLRNAGFSGKILEVETPRHVCDTLFSVDATDRETKKRGESFLRAVEKYELTERSKLSQPEEGHVVDVAEIFGGLRTSLINELVHQNLTGYYFLSRIDPDENDLGYVVLLREIRHIPRRLAICIGEGIDKEQCENLISENSLMAGRLAFDVLDFAMPVGQVTSPHLEHLMQVFSLLFGRIGIPDPSPEYVVDIWSRQPSVGEE